jgi:outer membrane protein assembly factor BamD
MAVGLRGCLFMRCHFLLLFPFLLLGCDSPKRDIHTTTADGLYRESCTLMKSTDYSEAAERFQEIEKLFPYSSKAAEGQILSAYCNFMAKHYMDAIRELDVFLKYRSSHRLAAYANYLRAMCMYMRVPSVERDSKTARDARKAFLEVAAKFPDSIYERDCLSKAVILNDIIVAHEMMIGRFYQKRKNIIGAINRYLAVIQDYGNSFYVPEALYRGIECFLSLGMVDEVLSLKRTLEVGYPGSKWHKKADALCKGRGLSSAAVASESKELKKQ